MHVLITGGLGFVGSELARHFLSMPEAERIILIVRSQLGLSANERIQKLVDYWRRFELGPDGHSLSKLDIVDADLEQPPLPQVHGPVDYVFHAAASTDLGASLNESRRSNLGVTQRVLMLAQRFSRLKRFVHFSTAYVCGRKPGSICETDSFPNSWHNRFHNHYERSKFEAEQAVRCSGLPYTILRPSIIVGRSDTGYMYRMKVLYSVWRLWLSGLAPRAPVDLKSWVDIIPVDYVVNAAQHLALEPRAVDGCIHLCAGHDRQSPEAIMRCAAEAFGVASPKTSPAWVAYALHAKPMSCFVSHGLREVLNAMYWHLPYLGIRGRLFDTSFADELLAGTHISRPKFSDYGPKLFRFCHETSWGKRPLVQRLQVSSGQHVEGSNVQY